MKGDYDRGRTFVAETRPLRADRLVEMPEEILVTECSTLEAASMK